jgi:hypothetical protein
MQAPERRGQRDLLMEQRFDDRFPCSDAPMVRVLPKPSFQALWAIVRDVSARGIGLILCHPLEIGTVLAIQMQRKRIGMSGILSGRVIHCSQQEDMTWRVGCVLSRRLSEDEISTLL